MKIFTQEKTIKFSILLFLITVLSRIPFLSKYLYYWDSVNFALGLDRYNVFEFRPAPPGYFLYIYITKLIYSFFTKDANFAFVFLSVISCGISAVMVFLFTKKIFSSIRAGICASIIFISSPVIFFHSITAFTYMLDGMFIMFFVYFAYCNIDAVFKKNTNYKYILKNKILMSIFLGLSAGVRQQDMLLLFPLYIFSLFADIFFIKNIFKNCKKPPLSPLSGGDFEHTPLIRGARGVKEHFKIIFISILCLIFVFLSWFIPMIILSGGLEKYLQACKLQGQCGMHEGVIGYLKYFIKTEIKLLKIILKTITIGVIPLIISLFLLDIKSVAKCPDTLLFFRLIFQRIFLNTFPNFTQKCLVSEHLSTDPVSAIKNLKFLYRMLFFITWIIPCLIFWYGFHLSNVGHTFTCLFAIFPLLGISIVSLSSKKPPLSPLSGGDTGDTPLLGGDSKHTPLIRGARGVNNKKIFEVLCAICVLFNLVIFFYDSRISKPFKNKTWYKEEDVRKRSDFLDQKIKCIEKNFNAKNTIIFADSGGSGNLAQAAYYLLDYEFYYISGLLENIEIKDKVKVLFAKGKEYIKPIDNFKLNKKIKNIVLFDSVYVKFLENKNVLKTVNLKRGVTIDWIELLDKDELEFKYNSWKIKRV